MKRKRRWNFMTVVFWLVLFAATWLCLDRLEGGAALAWIAGVLVCICLFMASRR